MTCIILIGTIWILVTQPTQAINSVLAQLTTCTIFVCSTFVGVCWPICEQLIELLWQVLLQHEGYAQDAKDDENCQKAKPEGLLHHTFRQRLERYILDSSTTWVTWKKGDMNLQVACWSYFPTVFSSGLHFSRLLSRMITVVNMLFDQVMVEIIFCWPAHMCGMEPHEMACV